MRRAVTLRELHLHSPIRVRDHTAGDLHGDFRVADPRVDLVTAGHLDDVLTAELIVLREIGRGLVRNSLMAPCVRSLPYRLFSPMRLLEQSFEYRVLLARRAPLG